MEVRPASARKGRLGTAPRLRAGVHELGPNLDDFVQRVATVIVVDHQHAPLRTAEQAGLGHVANDLRALCNLPTPKEAPKFDFDASDLTATDREVLQGLAKCMTDGPMKGKSVRLVGHADPRGETEYNMALGAKRADGVKSFLSGLGVAETRLHQTSRGELDAKGTDEESWLMDRRVDIEAAQ